MVELSEKAVRKVTSEIFETMLFMFAEEADQTPNENVTVRRATVDYVGPFEGTVVLRMPDTIIPEMTRNMLGEEEGYHPTADEEDDMLGEMANVISGNVLNALTDDKTVFGLKAPNVSNESENEPLGSGCETKRVLFNFEEGWAEVVVCVKQR